MLSLTRARHEQIVIFDRETNRKIATVGIARVQNGKVTLGIDASKQFGVLRGEIYKEGESNVPNGKAVE